VASETEQSIDEILLGVQALLQEARASLEQKEAFREPTFGPSLSTTSASEEVPTLLMMAVLESIRGHPAAPSARRWIIHQLEGRALSLGDIGGDRYADVRVSPRIFGPIQTIVAEGAVLEECDARLLHWRWPNVDREALHRVFGRLSPAVCLDQDSDGLRLHVPMLPERLALRFIGDGQSESSAGTLHKNAFALVDLDNSLSKPSTIFWLNDGGFVPDHLCGIAHHAGRWWPVLRGVTN